MSLRVKFATRAPGAGGASSPAAGWANPRATAKSVASKEDIVFLQSVGGKRQRPTVALSRLAAIMPVMKFGLKAKRSAEWVHAPNRLTGLRRAPLPFPEGEEVASGWFVPLWMKQFTQNTRIRS